MKTRRIISAFLCFMLLLMLYPAAAPAEVVILAPVLYSPEDGRLTSSNRPIYRGVSLGNVTIEIKIGGATVTTVVADQSGNWSCFQPTALADGSYTVYAVASDGAGHTSAASNASTFTVDTMPPAAPLINSPDNGSSINSNTFTVSGTGEANCTVHVYFNGSDAGTATADSSGNWQLHHTDTLADGMYMIYAMAYDAAGNFSYSANTCTLYVDATPPAAPVVSAPANACVTNNNKPAYTGTAELGSTVTIITDGSTVGTTMANGAGNWTFTQPTALSEGYHTIKATAADAIGNVSSDSNVNTFTVDTTPPAAPVVVSPANGSSTNHNTPNISGTAEANSTVTVFADGSAQGTAAVNGAGNWSFVQPSSLGDGAHTIKAGASDAAGNVSVDSNTNTFTVDTMPPAAPSVNVPANGDIINDSTPVCSGTADPGSTVHIFMDGSETGTMAADGSGNWSFTSASPLYDGPHAVKASASDWLGNTSACSNPNAFTVDTVPPDAPVITTPLSGSIAHVSKPILSGTAEPDSSLTVYIDGAPFTIHADGTGSWHTESSGLADGNHTISAQASDAAGNTGPASGTITFTVDTSLLPAVIVSSPANGSVTNSMAPDFSGTAEPKFTVDVFVDGAFISTVTAGAAGAWSLNAPSPLVDGPHTVYAEITVAAQTIQSGMNTFMVDTTPPAAPLVIAPAYGSSVTTGTPCIAGTAEAYSTVTILLDGAMAGTVSADGAGDWSFTPASALPAGDHTVKAMAQDAAGNAGPYSNDLVFSVSLPVTMAAIAGVTAPVKGGAPVSQITETNEYTGTVFWSPSGSRFRPDTVYTATITLCAKSGYSLSGAIADFFQVQGAAASNDAGSGVVRAVFPATAPFVNAVISPASCLYDMSDPADAATQITFHDAVSVTDVLLDAAPAPAPADYALNGNTLTIKAGYLSSLNLAMGDTLHFIIVFDAGASCALNVTVTDSAALRDAALAGIKVGGAAVAGFAADTCAYTVELPYGTLPGSAAAIVTAAPSRANAKVSIAQAAVLPGDAVVTVTAMDETTVRAYTVHLKLAPPVYYDVSFIDREETHAVRTVLAGTSIGGALWPADPRWKGYTFKGWYTGQDGSGSAFSASTAVNGKINVYAKWTSILSDIGEGVGILQPQVLLNGSATGLVTLTPDPAGAGRLVLTLGPGGLPVLMQQGYQLSVTMGTQPAVMPSGTVDMLFAQVISSQPSFFPQGTFDCAAALQFPSGLVTSPTLLGTLTCNTGMGSVTLPSNLLSGGAPQGASSDQDAVLTFMSGVIESNQGAFNELSAIRAYYVGLTVGGRPVLQADPELDLEMAFHLAFFGHTTYDQDYSVFHMDDDGNATLMPGSLFDPETGSITFDASDFGFFLIGTQP